MLIVPVPLVSSSFLSSPQNPKERIRIRDHCFSPHHHRYHHWRRALILKMKKKPRDHLMFKVSSLSLVYLLSLLCQRTLCQDVSSTSGSGSSVPLDDDELERIEKEHTRNVVRLAATDQLNSEIITNRTRGKEINCSLQRKRFRYLINNKSTAYHH